MKPSRWIAATLIAGLVGLPLLLGDAFAQGSVRIDGRTKSGDGEAPKAPEPTEFIDYREDMRELIQNLANFARRYNRNFIVLPMNGVDLLTKREDGDEDRRVPARTYLQAIDGVIQEALYYGKKGVDKKREESQTTYLEEWLGKAAKRGISVLVTDYLKDPKAIAEFYAKNKKNGYVSYAAPGKGVELNGFAKTPKRPINENAKSIISLNQVRNYAVLRDSSAFGTQEEFAVKAAQTNFDMLIVDPFHHRNEFLSRRTVDTLKYKKMGGKRLVLAYINIAAAEAFRYYWKGHWKTGSPDWIGYPYRGQPDVHHVQYWRPEWQQLLFGGRQSYVYGLVKDLGFDGIVLDGLEAYRYHEGAEEEE